MRKESQILEDMRTADSQDQKILAAELNRVRKAAAVAKAADAEVDLADSVIREALAPVRVHGMHSTATDWFEDMPSYTDDDLKTVASTMRVQANQWFSRLSPGVLADYDELAEQARGEARKVAGAYGEIAGEAADVFMDYVGHLVTLAEGTDAAGVPSAAGDHTNPDLEPWSDVPGDSSNEGHTLAPDAPDKSPEGGVPAAPVNQNPTTSAKFTDGDPYSHLRAGDDDRDAESWTQRDSKSDDDDWTAGNAAQSSLIARSAQQYLAVEEGKPFPIPGEYDPTQDGEAGTSLPIDVSWERQSQEFPTFVETPKEDAAAVSSERAPNVRQGGQYTEGPGGQYGEAGAGGQYGAGGDHGQYGWYNDDDDDKKKESSFSIKDTNGNSVAGPFDARGDAQQALASQFGPNAEDNGYSVLADGAQSHKGKDQDVNDPEFLGRNVEEAFGNGELPGNKESTLHEAAKCIYCGEHATHTHGDDALCDADYHRKVLRDASLHEAITTEPNPFGSKTYDPSIPTTKGYEEGYYFALLWEPGKPVPAAMSSAATIGHKYNAEYVVGYQAGVTAGIDTLGKATKDAFAAALSHHEVLAGAKWDKFMDSEHKRGEEDEVSNQDDQKGNVEEMAMSGSRVAHLPELADESQKDETASTPLNGNGGGGAAHVGSVPTPGQNVADYPQPSGGSGEPSIGGGGEAIEPWFSSGDQKLAAFKARVQESIRADRR